MHYENMVITRATNFWINFVPFVDDMWKKRIFEVFSSTKKYMESVGVCGGIYHLSNYVMNM